MRNIPVGAEKDSFRQDIVSNILRQHIILEGDNISLLTSIYHVTQISNIFSEGLRQH